jgi:hypothetical protein
MPAGEDQGQSTCHAAPKPMLLIAAGCPSSRKVFAQWLRLADADRGLPQSGLDQPEQGAPVQSRAPPGNCRHLSNVPARWVAPRPDHRILSMVMRQSPLLQAMEESSTPPISGMECDAWATERKCDAHFPAASGATPQLRRCHDIVWQARLG